MSIDEVIGHMIILRDKKQTEADIAREKEAEWYRQLTQHQLK